ncbi:MAG: hypothetical protein JSW07_05085 [bacterium]|nr:MAG: hypothetical protein JSW07_05085 [bacterium]
MNKTLIASLILLIQFFVHTSLGESKISNDVNEIVRKIEEINALMGSAVDYSGKPPAQYENFVALRKTATTNELVELTNHKNGVVRCYSFWALSYKENVDLFPIIINHISDDEEVKTQFGCKRSIEKAGDFFIDIATPEHFDSNSKKLDSSQLKKLDNILIFTPNNLNATFEAIRRAEPSERIYERIRELAVKEKNQEAVVVLAKYQKEQDIKVILNNKDETGKRKNGLFFTYRAISYFPHQDFIPFLERNLKDAMGKTGWRNEYYELYNAIARYQNEDAKRLLEIPFREIKHDNSKTYHMNFIFQAIRSNKAEIYDHLLWRLWAEENKISLDVLEYLFSQNLSRTNELIKKNLKNEEFTLNGLFDNEVVERMLDLVLEQNKAYGLEVIRININKADVHLFPVFAKKALEIKDESFVEPLFERLEKEWNHYIYLEIIRALITYDDKEINQRILQARENNKHLKKDWSDEEFNSLLKENSAK